MSTWSGQTSAVLLLGGMEIYLFIIIVLGKVFFFFAEYYFRKVGHDESKMLLNYNSQRIESKDINIMKPTVILGLAYYFKDKT